jgi:hypothetical protein
MATVDQALKTLRTLKPPSAAAGHELNSITEPVTRLDVWGLLEAVRMFVSLTQEQQKAVERLEAFVTNPALMKFTRLSRADVALGAAARVCNNALVDQNAFGICGPAAVAMEIARSRPAEYVKLVTHLCDTGECHLRGLQIVPHARILGYDPGKSIPPVDWVVCASLRNDGDSLTRELDKATYGGSNVLEVYDWMIRAGYKKVVAVSVQPFFSFCKIHPDTLRPPVLDASDPARALEIAVDLSRSGWQVLLSGYMSLTRGIVALHRGEDMVADPEMAPELRKVIHDKMMADQKQALLTPVPGHLGLIGEGVSRMFGGTPADTRHWILIERMEPSTLDGSLLTVTVCTHGVRHRGTNVPFSGIANKFTGYVAATDMVQ